MIHKALFFDIDGTLVSFQTHQIPQSTQEAIQELRKKGHKVFIATGRALCDINNLKDLTFDGYITANGAYCVDAQRNVIAENCIPKENLHALALYQQEYPFPCVCMTNDGNFINFINDPVRSIHELVNLSIPPVMELPAIIEKSIYQIDAYIDQAQEVELISQILTNCTSNRWHPAFTDINAKNTHKAAGMDQLLTYFNIDLSHTFAFGDGGNDIPMLNHAAISIAMGDAGSEVKQAADYVTTSVDEDGILKALQYFDLL